MTVFEIKDITEGNDEFLLYRIVKNHRVDSLTRDGQIRFGLLEEYRKMELQNMKEIGDHYEASLSTRVAEYLNINGEYHEIHGPNAGCNMRINANQCSFCCYYAGLKNFTKRGENHYQFVLSASEVEKLCADKDGADNCSIVVFDSNVVHKVYKALKERNLPYAGRRVVYDDYDYIPEHDIHSWQYALECTFHKQKRYGYQREFRITALNEGKEAITDLYIPVDDKDFDVIALKSGFGLNCEIELNPQYYPNGVVEVAINAQLGLERAALHEA